MFARTLTHGDHTRQFSIRDAGTGGWELHEERDSQVVRHVRYHDWHRVERARAALELEVADLERDGWTAATA